MEKHPIYAESESAGKGVAPATMERVRAVVASARRVVRRLIVVGRGSGGFGSECENESESERVGGTVVVRQAGVYTKGRLKLGTRLFGQLVQYGYVVCVQSGGVPRVEQLVAGLKDFESSNLVMLYICMNGRVDDTSAPCITSISSVSQRASKDRDPCMAYAKSPSLTDDPMHLA